ncbi:MAG: methyl-accepting chemotaxis protein [Hormoscilla sp.]
MVKQMRANSLVVKFLVLFLPLWVVASAIWGWIYNQQVQEDKVALLDRQTDKVDRQAKGLVSDFDSIVSDLMILAEENELQLILDGRQAIDKTKQALGKEYLLFARHKKIYDQIRYLDARGQEVVRVNFNQGYPVIVPSTDLQSQAGRYYFRDTLGLQQGEVFMSPFDLNMERGKVEQPLKPVIRFGMPVFNSRGQKRGIVIINYLGEKLLDNLERQNSTDSGISMLLNSQGFWLKGASPESEWGFMFPDRKDRTFGRAFPQAWQRISQSASGQFETSEGLFAFTTIYPLLEIEKLLMREGFNQSSSNNQSYYWKIVSYVPPAVLQEISHRDLWQLLPLYVGMVGAIAIVALLISKQRQLAEQTRDRIAGWVSAAEKISAGDLTQEIEVDNHKDELGKLLAAFQTMTASLNSLIRQVQESGIQVTSSTTEIAASGKQLEATMAEQSASTNEVTAAAKEIASTSSELVQTMGEVGDRASRTANAAGQGQQDLAHMETTMNQLVNSTRTISAKLGLISEKAHNISSVVTTITKVADRTNLLSLNAAIEAEKAGEAGAGFAVVAREIRRLADQTSVATLDIESTVKDMQSAVSTGVMEMDKFTKEVSTSVEDIRKISQQLVEIISQVQSLTPRFEAVSQGMENQAQSAQQISETMSQLSEVSQQTADSLHQTNSALDNLHESVAGLQQEISRFQVN